MGAPYDVRAVEYRPRGGFATGPSRLVDLTDKLSGTTRPVFEPSRDRSSFATAAVDAGTCAVAWPNGADLAPDAMHGGAFSTASTTWTASQMPFS